LALREQVNLVQPPKEELATGEHQLDLKIAFGIFKGSPHATLLLIMSLPLLSPLPDKDAWTPPEP